MENIAVVLIRDRIFSFLAVITPAIIRMLHPNIYGYANLLFSNWLNYFVYQETPYDFNIPHFNRVKKFQENFKKGIDKAL